MSLHKYYDQQLATFKIQCENQMAEFERNFNYRRSQEVLRNILFEINSLKQKLEQDESDHHSQAMYLQENKSSPCEIALLILKVEARVYECIGTIYLSLSLPNQSLSVLQRASDIMQQIQKIQLLNLNDKVNSISDTQSDNSVNMQNENNVKDLKQIARILIKISSSLFLLAEKKSSYTLLRDAHALLKQNNLLESEEEALLYFNFDDLSEICYNRCISLREKLFGKKSPIVYEAQQELAKLYIESGQLTLADKLVNEVISFKQEYYGENSPSTSVAYLYRATLLFITSSNIDDAYQDVLKSLKINTLNIGETNKYNAECYLLLGRIISKKQPISSQQFNLNQQNTVPFSWSQYKSTTSPSSSSPTSQSSQQSPSSKSSSSNSLIQYDTSSYFNLQQIKLNQLQISQDNQANNKQYKLKDPLNYNSQINKVGDNSNLEPFLPYFNKAVQILKTLYGEYNGCVGIAYNAIGKVLLSLRHYERALNCFNTSIDIYSRNTPENDFNICQYFALKNAADCNMKLGRLKTAHHQYQTILDMKEQLDSIFQLDGNQNQNPLHLQQQNNNHNDNFNLLYSNTLSFTIEDEHKKLFVPPIDIDQSQIIHLLDQSKTED